MSEDSKIKKYLKKEITKVLESENEDISDSDSETNTGTLFDSSIQLPL